LAGPHNKELSEGVPLFYDELRSLAAQYLRSERNGHTLQPTALVHEAWLQLAPLKDARLKNRAQFFAIAAQTMRRILVGHARRRQALKRAAPAMSFSMAPDGPEDTLLDVLTVDRMLTRLESIHAAAGQTLELRFFGGLNDSEIAEYLEISRATVQRRLDFGKAWISRELGPP
jgi:RNA polymerase sigma-70 factor (ECF subfamily)